MNIGANLDAYQLKDFAYSSHSWILKFISRANRSPRILDVGTADGYLGAILKHQGHFVVGVERDMVLAEKARAGYDIFHTADIESFSFPYEKDFDVIILADLLEHVRDPSTVLCRCLRCLKDNGQVIMSIPNIANFYVRMNLLLGGFEYSDRGILDATHVLFLHCQRLRG